MDKLKKEIVLITLVILSIIYFIILFSHVYDEKPFSGGISLTDSKNYLGIFGAYIADFSLSTIGFSSYVLAISLVILAFRYYLDIFQNINSWIFLIKFIIFCFFIINTTALFGLINVSYGGYLGELINNITKPIFANGLWIIYIALEFILISMLIHISWFKLIADIAKTIKLIINKIVLFIKAIINFIIRFINLFTKKQSKKSKTNTNKIKVKLRPKTITAPIPVKTNSSINNLDNINEEILPPIDLLDKVSNDNIVYSSEELNFMADKLVAELSNFGIDVEVVDIVPGPVITSFEIELPAGVKASKVLSLDKDLARALLVSSVRIIDVIAGKHTIGIEIPNANRQLIALSEIISSNVYKESRAPLTMCLGKDTTGSEMVINLAKTPHLLVAGATGMGKSVALNAMLMGILYKSSPKDVRMVMIDPKVVELAIYADIPHLLTPVITDMNEASSALFWCVSEMERRYSLLAKFGVRNITGFNQKILEAKESGKPILSSDYEDLAEGEEPVELEELPLIVIVIDEYADMLGALSGEDRSKAKRTEGFIIRIAQKARAAGIHLVIATQRPSVDVITGLIKSNIPSRVAFKVSSKIDSRTILDQGGAEALLGMGDMLYMMPGNSSLTRVHGAFVSDKEITRVVDFLKKNYPTNYATNITQLESDDSFANNGFATENSTGELDPLYDEAVEFVLSSGKVSISGVQRRLRIGYNRAARIIEDMEIAGLVSPMNANGSRDILAPKN